MASRTLPLVLAALLSFACNGFAADGQQAAPAAPPAAPAPQAAAPATSLVAVHNKLVDSSTIGPKQAGVPRVVFLGDSITRAQGLKTADVAYPALLQEQFKGEGLVFEAVNAGQTGDTTGMAEKRLPSLLVLQPDVLVVALGGNDAVTAQAASDARKHLEEIIKAAQAAGVKVLLAGLHMPAHVTSADRARDYDRMYVELSQELKVPLVPDFMDGCFGQPDMVQADKVHPTIAGQKRVAENFAPALRELLKGLKT